MTRTFPTRPGAILLIVLVLLALFAVIGLSFVLYAQSEAVNSRIHREAMVNTTESPDPQAAVTSFLQQLIYPVQDSGLNVTSALRGHSLATLMYGNHPDHQNIVPYGGIGAFSEPVPSLGLDRRQVINHSGISPTDIVLQPEWTNINLRYASEVYNGLPFLTSSVNGVFVGKNAPYTYPDRNNVMIAMLDPETGRVVMPSYHRPGLFNQGWPAVAGQEETPQNQLRSLDPANPNWTNNTGSGRARILRPRPFDHRFDSNDGRGPVSDFPYPPPNPDRNSDGTYNYTGDVQNLRYSHDIQHNDSVWLHMNLPQVKYKGRTLQPLIAPIILPLDGRVNFNVAGNSRDAVNGHTSHSGYGPYEINPRRVLVPQNATTNINPMQDAQRVLNTRYTGSNVKPSSATQAMAVASARVDPNLIDCAIMDYSPVAWESSPTSTMTFPNLPFRRTEPQFASTGWTNNKNADYHESLFNPYFANEGGVIGGRTLRLMDLRQTAYRYSARSSNYSPPLFGVFGIDTSFTGNTPHHPSGRTRANSTTISNTMNRATFMPNFLSVQAGNYGLPPTASGLDPITPQAVPQSFTPNSVPFPSNNDNHNFGGNAYRSAAAYLPPVDINRPLADYRGNNKSAPLANNVTPPNANLAVMDRQILAKDIFDRFVIATGVQCDGFDPVTRRPIGFSTVAPGSPAFNALRYLAQLAVNIVDQVDVDDINTAFIWNPVGSVDPAQPTYASNFIPTALPNSVVFGVEKPRLVINEVYAEVTNHESDDSQSANQDFQVRFFIEALNPLNALSARNNPNPDTSAPMKDGTALLRTGGHSVYRFQIYKDSTEVQSRLHGPAAVSNVTGNVGTPSPSNELVPGSVPFLQVTMPQNAVDVPPNDGQAENTGFREFAPQNVMNDNDGGSEPMYKPQNDPIVLVQVPNGGAQNSLYYSVPKRKPNEIPNQTLGQLNGPGGQGRHAVVLQRLANPYLSPNDPREPTFNPTNPINPYITVDVLYDIRVNDAIRVGDQEDRPPPMAPIPGTRNPANSPPDSRGALTTRQSHARRGPMYAFRGQSANASFAVDSAMTNSPLRLRSHNTTPYATSVQLFPRFEWLTHFDRKFVSPMEALQVAGVKPHELLQYFATSGNPQFDNAQPANLHRHLTPWVSGQANLARALESLTVKPWMYGVPVGGRQPGKININMIWHRDVVEALVDKNNGNEFPSSDPFWDLITSRTPNMNSQKFVTSTVDEGNPTGDRPIKSLGAANFGGGSATPTSKTLSCAPTPPHPPRNRGSISTPPATRRGIPTCSPKFSGRLTTTSPPSATRTW